MLSPVDGDNAISAFTLKFKTFPLVFIFHKAPLFRLHL